jgi:hypothetical protein
MRQIYLTLLSVETKHEAWGRTSPRVARRPELSLWVALRLLVLAWVLALVLASATGILEQLVALLLWEVLPS